MNVAMVVGVFPTPTETWIPDQIIGLLSRGIRVTVFAAPPARAEAVHPSVLAHRLLERVVYQPRRPASRLGRLIDVPMQALLNAGTDPRAVLGSLNYPRFGAHTLTGGLTYPIIPLARHLPTGGFDLIHAHDASVAMAPAAMKAMGRSKLPLLVTIHGPDINEPRNVVRARGYALLKEHADAFTVGSEYIRRRAVRLGIDTTKVHTIPQSIRPAEWPFAQRRPDPDGGVRLVCVGRLSPVKGLHLAIGALADLAKAHPRVRLQLVGDGPLRAELAALAAARGIADRVDFLGMLTRDRLLPVLQQAHVLVHPGVELGDGFGEAQGVVLLEAQACGLPVLTTTAGGIPEGVEHGVSAIVVPHSDQAALTRALDDLLARPGAWPEMGRAGRALVERRFSLEPMLDALTSLYDRLRQTTPPTR